MSCTVTCQFIIRREWGFGSVLFLEAGYESALASWIRIRFKVKILELSRLEMEL
jgi:hypothetical protein